MDSPEFVFTSILECSHDFNSCLRAIEVISLYRYFAFY